jgi:sialate O-acetylesterase
VLEADADFAPILKRYADAVANYPNAMEEHKQKLAEWKEAAEKAKAEGKNPPRRPRAPFGPGHPHTPSGLYNAMIAPLIPYGIAGAIWYQGESNAGRAYQYRTLFPAMIKNWRDDWGVGKFPFLFVQLANFMETKPEPDDSAWAELREAQLMTLALPNTGMAVIIDIGEADDIHPKNKQDVGKRLALWALADTYGKKLVKSGPIYTSMKVDGNSIVLSFDHVGGGLVAKDGEGLKGFAIAGKDRKFVWADAKIEGDTVVVSSDEVSEPAAVRYAWADNPVCNLYNQEDLPASPFRTDKWPGVTVDAR